MKSEIARPLGSFPLRRLALAILLMAVVAGLLFAAYKLGLFGSFIDRSLRSVQTSLSEDQSLTIPGAPLCLPASADPNPQSAIGNPQSVFGLAWFHKPPQDGSTAADIAADDRYIHLTGAADIPFRNSLRAAGYVGPILTYVAMDAVEGPGPYKDASAQCDAGYQGRDNQTAFNKGDFCTYIHPNESWFLHNSKGQRLYDDYFGSGRISYLMNPGDPGWRAFAWSRLAYIKNTWFYDGIWLDNVDLDMSRAWSGVTNSDGGLAEYQTQGEWQQAVEGWLAGLRAQVGDSYPVWANLVGGGVGATSWDPYATYLDGAMDESFAVSWINNWRSSAQWQGQVQRAQRWLNMGKGLVMVGQGPKDDTARLDFTLASYMLVANNNAFFRYTRYDTYYEQLWLYPEYDTARALGNPLGTCQATTSGVWRRDFTHGYVEVDSNQHTGRLVLNR